MTGRIACLVVAACLSAGGRAATQTETLADAYAQYDEALKLYEADEYAKAASMADRSLATRERLLGPDDPDVARSLALVGRTHNAAGEVMRAQTMLDRALQANERAFGVNDLAVADVLIDRYKNAGLRADYPAAERDVLRALQIRRDTLQGDAAPLCEAERRLSELYLATGAYDKAEAPAARAMEIAHHLPSSNRCSIEALLTEGRVALVGSHLDEAEHLIDEALDRSGGEGLLASDAIQNLGLLALRRGDNGRAEELLQRAVAIKERLVGPTHPSLVNPLGNLGIILYRRRNYQDAERVLARALTVQEQATGPNQPEVGRIVNNMGLVAWQQRNYPRATELFRRCLEIQEHFYGPESREVAGALGNLGIVAKETGDYKSAEVHYLRALTIAEKLYGAETIEVRQNLESLGILRTDEGDYDGAEPFLKRALAITTSRLGSLHPDVARELTNLARLEWARGRTDAALAYMQRETQVEDNHLLLNIAVGSEREKLAFFDPFMVDLERAVSFYLVAAPNSLAARDLATTMLLRRKGRVFDALSDSLGAVRRRSTPDEVVLLDQLGAVTSELATLVLNGPRRMAPGEHAARVDVLTARRESLEAQLNSLTAGYERADAVTLPAVLAAVPADAALVEFVVYEPYAPRTPVEKRHDNVVPRYAVCVIPHNGTPQWRDLGAADEIDEAVARFRAALRDPTRADVRALGRALDRRIGAPVRALSSGATHLLVSADGQLDLVPFEALVDERGRFLVERLGITYLTTGRDLLRMQMPRPAGHGLMIVAAPQFGEPEAAGAVALTKASASSQTARRSVTIGRDRTAVYFAPLIGTQTEARAINALFPRASMLVGAQATESAVKRADAPEILHIATHGFFLEDKTAIPNPLLRSGLALAGANRKPTADGDGVLTALEASGMNLWGTHLVTLSACDTGVGEVRNGEGVYGLRRAFFLAGAETVVMSLWPVSDYVTREIMTGYYRGLRDGLGRGEALRRVELSMLARADRRHPFYWASFVQAGEWANLSGKR